MLNYEDFQDLKEKYGEDLINDLYNYLVQQINEQRFCINSSYVLCSVKKLSISQFHKIMIDLYDQGIITAYWQIKCDICREFIETMKDVDINDKYEIDCPHCGRVFWVTPETKDLTFKMEK